MLLATLLPGLSLLNNRRKWQGVLFLLLQPTIIGWIWGAIYARKNLRRQRSRRWMKLK